MVNTLSTTKYAITSLEKVPILGKLNLLITAVEAGHKISEFLDDRAVHLVDGVGRVGIKLWD